MKLNKREKQAFAAMRSILDAFEYGKVIGLDAAEVNAIYEVFGIDLKSVTMLKRDVSEFVRGKNDAHIVYIKPFSAWSKYNKVKSYGYFPFQIKKLNSYDRSFPIIEPVEG